MVPTVGENGLEYKLAAQASAFLKKLLDALARASSLYLGSIKYQPPKSPKSPLLSLQLRVKPEGIAPVESVLRSRTNR